MSFKTYEEFRQALFDGEELCYGYDKVIPNPWFQMCDEQILLLRDIAKGGNL